MFRVRVKSLCIALSVMALGRSATSVHAQVLMPARSGPEIVTSASGEAQLVPDRAAVYIGVQTRASTAAAAARDNAQRQSAVIGAVIAAGVPREQISTEPHEEQDPHDGRIRVSPLARKIAKDRGVDLSKIKGSGPGGRIVKQDVIDAPASQEAQEVEARPLQPQQLPVPVLPHRVSAGATEIVPLSKMRQVIATRLQQ